MRKELELLEQARGKNVIFVGETIIDVYHYVRPLGKPTKDAIVSVEHLETEEFTGGVAAAAAHVADCCERVDVFSGGHIIRKERFVEQSHVRKLFECYRNVGVASTAFPAFSDYDAIIVTDYGHGMIDSDMVRELCDGCCRFLAVNVQTNSGNYGFNLATKYPSADYLCVDEPEARLATQNRSGPIEHSVEKLAAIAPKVVVTLGKAGAVGFDRERMYHCDSFTDRVVDTMGAGDAFFALTALVAEQADMESLLRIGNAAGALKSQIVGHRGHVTKNELVKLLSESR